MASIFKKNSNKKNKKNENSELNNTPDYAKKYPQSSWNEANIKSIFNNKSNTK